MIETAQNVADRYGLTREEIDAFALRSQQHARAALSGVLGTIGKRSLGKAFSNGVKAIEARNAANDAGGSAAAAS